MKTITLAAIAASLALAGCATNQKVATNQLGDGGLSCADITSQDKKLDDLLEKAQHNKGVSGANVAAVLLFWPAAVGNYMDADKAEQLVTKRKTVLADLYKSKRCEA
jgi:outer membrane murein-binding lipoprotein Lpp